MGIIKELRDYMVWSRAQGSIIRILKDQNKDLHNRLMSRDYSEYALGQLDKNYQEPNETVYNPLNDEGTAGQVINNLE